MSSSQNYVTQRLDEQALWHEQKATQYKQRYHILQIVIIVASSIIPIINLIDFAPLSVRVLSAILGSLIAATAGILQLKKYQEDWLLYRSIEMALRREKFLFEYTAGEYFGLTDEQKSKVLVEKVEDIISSGTSKFVATHQPIQTKTNSK